jgi:hypothetical protein
MTEALLAWAPRAARAVVKAALLEIEEPEEDKVQVKERGCMRGVTYVGAKIVIPWAASSGASRLVVWSAPASADKLALAAVALIVPGMGRTSSMT